MGSQSFLHGKRMFKYLMTAVALIALPLLGITLAGFPVGQYFEFPPVTRYVYHAAYSRPAFMAYLCFIVAATAPVLYRIILYAAIVRKVPEDAQPFPWLGWLGLTAGMLFWILAWTRFSWFRRFQLHTFVPLWMCYILVVNALVYRRQGRCMITAQPGFFLMLFPVSSLFWWFFEYLNRYAQNWYYTGVELSPLEYVGYAMVAFSMVLPAVLGTREWIRGIDWFDRGFRNWVCIDFGRFAPIMASAVLITGLAGLAMVGIWPDYLFAMLWVAPVFILVSLQVLAGEEHVFSGIAVGDWRPVISSVLAALICGCFWEMWNWKSLAKWGYSLPFVDRYPIFEMPVLGYAGYLPFGIECAIVGAIVEFAYCHLSGQEPEKNSMRR